MDVRVGDWIQYNIGTPYDEIDEVLATQQGYYVVRDGVCVYPSQVLEVRHQEQS